MNRFLHGASLSRVTVGSQPTQVEIRAGQRGLILLFGFVLGCVTETQVEGEFCVPVTTVISPYQGPVRRMPPLDCASLCGGPPWKAASLHACSVVGEGEGVSLSDTGASSEVSEGPETASDEGVGSAPHYLQCVWTASC